jgi:hypothetical protein
MNTDTRINAMKTILLALDEVQSLGGRLPEGDPEAGEAPPATFFDLVKSYSGSRIPESELLVAIDAMAPLFASFQFPWK